MGQATPPNLGFSITSTRFVEPSQERSNQLSPHPHLRDPPYHRNTKMLSLNRLRPVAMRVTCRRWLSTKKQQLIINAVGTDRLGIVSDMTKEVIEVGGNVGESQAAKLGKHFSLMMLVSVPNDQVDALQQRLSALKDLTATMCVTDSEGSHKVPSHPAIAYRGQLTLEGADNPGIVHKVTKILATNGLNIDKLETSDELAPGGSTVLFKMKGVAHAYAPLASGFDVAKIKDELAHLGDSLNCDIVLEDMMGEEYHGSFHAG